MRNDVEQMIFVPNDLEVESPTQVHSRLPDFVCFVDLLGVERRMVEVPQEESRLLPKCPFDKLGSLPQAAVKAPQ